MTTAAKTAFGAELWMGPAGGTLVKLAELLSVTPPKTTRELMDATSHDSAAGAMEQIASGVYDPGEVTARFNYIAGSTDDLALLAASTDGVKRDFKVVVKSSASTKNRTFSGFVTEYGADDLPVSGKQEATVTIKVTGAVTQS